MSQYVYSPDVPPAPDPRPVWDLSSAERSAERAAAGPDQRRTNASGRTSTIPQPDPVLAHSATTPRRSRKGRSTYDVRHAHARRTLVPAADRAVLDTLIDWSRWTGPDGRPLTRCPDRLTGSQLVAIADLLAPCDCTLEPGQSCEAWDHVPRLLGIDDRPESWEFVTEAWVTKAGRRVRRSDDACAPYGLDTSGHAARHTAGIGGGALAGWETDRAHKGEPIPGRSGWRAGVPRDGEREPITVWVVAPDGECHREHHLRTILSPRRVAIGHRVYDRPLTAAQRSADAAAQREARTIRLVARPDGPPAVVVPDVPASVPTVPADTRPASAAPVPPELHEIEPGAILTWQHGPGTVRVTRGSDRRIRVAVLSAAGTVESQWQARGTRGIAARLATIPLGALDA